MSGKKKKKKKKPNRVYITSELYVDLFFFFVSYALFKSHCVLERFYFKKMVMGCKTKLNCFISHSIYVAASYLFCTYLRYYGRVNVKHDYLLSCFPIYCFDLHLRTYV